MEEYEPGKLLDYYAVTSPRTHLTEIQLHPDDPSPLRPRRPRMVPGEGAGSEYPHRDEPRLPEAHCQAAAPGGFRWAGVPGDRPRELPHGERRLSAHARLVPPGVLERS